MVIFDTETISEGIVRFEKGIPGFGWIRAMQLEQIPRGLWLLKSVGPHFVMIPPKNVRPDLELDIDDAVASRLRISSPLEAFALSVVKLEPKENKDIGKRNTTKRRGFELFFICYNLHLN